ncbi:Oidioi.mRNA.OKI2018_I69.XSR.g14050.t1.cds [Oikopleura dioica]|uniref:Oidioi.mRNA.OKI2018_I69.XSR.g14050.t1.cds n=1 Tax=Oikopleura dioica TaxID=34765 RepID=A0ABN7S8Q1_OIKDI|nr:Oidioi.mRNA.OKI2018_I69.XSR.g14050.t1.cds [Oikopleura dioica]
MSPVSGSIMPGTVHREPMSPRCRLWRMGELENALPRTVSESGHIVVSPNSSGLCTCSRCQRENLDRLEELERTVQDLTRQNADMRQQFDDLQQKNQSIRERAQRIETCAICCFPYSEERDNVDASNRCTFRKCGHICCTKCVQQQLSLAQSG